MKGLILLFIAACLFTTISCSGDHAAELFETAQFEELQNNRGHAVQLYEEIIKSYPQSEYAPKAQARLSEITRSVDSR